MLIGIAEGRRTLNAGLEYTRLVWQGDRVRLEYRAEISPIFRESDPTMVATETTILGTTIVTPIPAQRVVRESHAPIGQECVGSGPCSPVYPVYGADEVTYGALASPIGARAVFGPRKRLAFTVESDVGLVGSSRDVPVDDATRWNYQFAFGPGLQISPGRLIAIRLEYVFRHLSNANSGIVNPGIDQGTFRLSVARYRR